MGDVSVTGATPSAEPVGLTIDQAAAKIEEMGKPQEPAKPATPKAPVKPIAAVATPEIPEGDAGETSVDDDGTEGDGTADPDGTGEETPDVGEERRSVLHSWTEEQLAAKVLLPVGDKGELVEVPMREVLRGHLREADYTRKTMALSQEAQRLQSERSAYAQVLPVLFQSLQQQIGERTDEQWQQLYESDPVEFARQRYTHEGLVKRLQAVQQEQARVQSEMAQENAMRASAFAAQEVNKLRNVFPELADPAKAKQFGTEMISYLKEDVGLNDDEIKSLVDHRAIRIIRKAQLYDRLQKSRESAKAKGAAQASPTPIPQTTAGKPPATSKDRKIKEARTELKKTGSVDAAAKAIMAKLGG